MRLEVPCYPQKDPASCLTACIRAVLAYDGLELDEDVIQAVCQTTPAGTLPSLAMTGLRDLGHEAVLVEDGDLGLVWRCLADEQPLIVFLDGTLLPESPEGAHAVVVTGYENEAVCYLDPALGEEIQVPRDVFLRAWRSLGGDGLLIWVND